VRRQRRAREADDTAAFPSKPRATVAPLSSSLGVDYSWWDAENAVRRGEAVREQLEGLPWWQGQLDELEPDPEVVVETVATEIAASDELRLRRLGSLLPGLARLPERPSRARYLGTRGTRVLERNARDSFRELARFSAAEMLAWPECGEKTVMEILSCAIDLWVARTWDSSDRPSQPRRARPAPSLNGFSSSPRSPNAVSTRMALDAVGIAAYRAGAANVGEAVALMIESSVLDPEEPAAIGSRALLSLRLDDVLGLQLDHAWDVLLDFEERELRILEARARTHPVQSTQSSLGQELGISTARVGQIEQRCRRTISQRLQADACAPIIHHASRLRRELGTSISAAVLDALLGPLLPNEASHPLLCRDILLAQAGPYRLEDGFWRAASS
jgi:hypothetical protein